MLRLLAALRRLHARLVPWLEVPADRLGPWVFGLALLAIVVVGAIVRARMALQGLSGESLFHGNPMLSSTDGFYFAAGVGNTLTTAWGDPPRLPYWEGHALVALAAGLVKLLGANRDAVIAWLPVVVGPLVAVPLAFLGRALGRSLLGLSAGLFAMVAPAYFVRSVLGYFDTDMFTLTVPLVAVVFLVRLFMLQPDAPPEEATRRARRDALFGAIVLALYIWFYDQSSSISLATALLSVLGLGGLALFRKADPKAPVSPALVEAPRHALLLSLTGIPIFWALRALALTVTHFVLNRIKVAPTVLVALAVVGMGASLATSPAGRELLDKLTVYGDAERPDALLPGADPTSGAKVPDADTSWRTIDTTGVVSEARVLPLPRMAEKLAGHWLLAIAGALGFLGLLLWRPSLFVLLPITGVGVFAFIGGHRFLMYLAPAIGLGIAWLIAVFTRPLAARARQFAGAALGVVAVVPAMTGVSDAEITAAFHASEADILLQLDARSQPNDTTIAWWDFGYPIQYFAKTRTICDGSRRGDDAAFAAEILLTTSPQRASRLARLMADASAINTGSGGASLVQRAAKRARLGPEAFLTAVENGTWRSYRRSGDVYLFLSKRMVPILPVLDASRPQSATKKRGAFYQVVLPGVRSEGSILHLQDGLIVDANTVKMRRPRPNGGGYQEKSLREVIVVGGSGPTFQRASRKGDPNANTSGILLRDLRIFIELDPRLLETQFAQLYYFENADPAYYEPVVLTPTTKIYRFKQ